MTRNQRQGMVTYHHMNILAIETSCDETAISLLEATETDSGAIFRVYGDITRTQLEHVEYGGVFPALAKREHQKNLVPILLEILKDYSGSTPASSSDKAVAQALAFLDRESELKTQFEERMMTLPKPSIDYICVTSGPGLEPALWVGISFAQALGALWDIPVVPVNHMEGHILSVLVPETQEENKFIFNASDIVFPALALLISGGHTELVLMNGVGDYKIIGKTRDDAVGEAFDKAARILGLPYPGGPEISKLAQKYTAQPLESRTEIPPLPRPMMHTKDYDFSFSGLKTAVLYFVKTLATPISESMKEAVAYEFEQAVSEVITYKTKKAIDDLGVQTLIVGGGVAANKEIKKRLGVMLAKDFPEVKFMTPTKELSTDNSLMIAIAGYFKIKRSPSLNFGEIKAQGNWEL